jgi:nucleoside phosphorylase
VQQLSPNKIKLLIIAALKNEILPVKNYLKDFYSETIIIDFLITGVGKNTALQKISDYHQQNPVDFLLNIGTCGSLDDDTHLGAIIFAEEFICKAADSRQKIKGELLQKINLPAAYRFGKFYSSETPVLKTEEKERIKKNYNVDFVDMEGYWLAEYCQLNNIDFLSVKVVSDFAENVSIKEFREKLPELAKKLTEPTDIIIKMAKNYGK